MGTLKDCSSLSSAKIITVKGEHGRRVSFPNPEAAKYLRIRLDGCLIENAKAADWLLKRSGIADLVIELKGSNIDHAVHQIVSSVSHLAKTNILEEKVAGLVICSRMRLLGTNAQIAQNDLRKKFKCKISFRVGDRTESFEKLTGC